MPVGRALVWAIDHKLRGNDHESRERQEPYNYIRKLLRSPQR